MGSRLAQLLLAWKKPFIRDQDLIPLFQGEETKRYDTVKYAIRKGTLVHVRRGLYLIGPPFARKRQDPYELAGVMYGPSYISLQSALSFYGWIPEAVYATTSVTAKRPMTTETPIGMFRYFHTPPSHFFINVERMKNDEATFLIAEPWKAVADMIYCYKKKWKSIYDLSSDMRIEVDTMEESDLNSLSHIAIHYKSARVRHILINLQKELSK